jgi:hypothetical protein
MNLRISNNNSAFLSSALPLPQKRKSENKKRRKPAPSAVVGFFVYFIRTFPKKKYLGQISSTSKFRHIENI